VGEHMKRIMLSMPVKMLAAWREAVRNDGRSQSELLRALVAQYIKELGITSKSR